MLKVGADLRAALYDRARSARSTNRAATVARYNCSAAQCAANAAEGLIHQQITH